MISVTRPAISDVMARCHTLANKVIHLPKTTNKGIAGIFLEKSTGIPTSSACIDCIDGEVKLYPLKRLTRNGKYGTAGELVPKETVAITMMDCKQLIATSWEESRLKKKISKLLFVAYLRDGDSIIFQYMHLISNSNPEHQKYYDTFAKDYQAIRDNYITTGSNTGKIGTYIQCRTKGPGNGAPKTRAFYFRPGVMNSLEKIFLKDS